MYYCNLHDCKEKDIEQKIMATHSCKFSWSIQAGKLPDKSLYDKSLQDQMETH